ncbi:MAG: GNAT family N-acetyltransferase [Spirochaetota bacterium]|jgi:GNAT superfamily N-acetyltransferase|nr:GNAT family N-acetyltransferase [Spirochaetota bacterium]
MEIQEFSWAYFDAIFEVVHTTIETIYPKYYPRSAVDFCLAWHSRENMQSLLPKEKTLVLLAENTPLGTCSLSGNEVKRLFVLPEYQGKGYGKMLLRETEKLLDTSLHNELVLAASLGAVDFYRKAGYAWRDYKTIETAHGDYLCYLEMARHCAVP